MAFHPPSGGSSGYSTIQEEGAGLTQRPTMNFIGAAVTAADDAGNTRTNVTVASASTTQEGTAEAAIASEVTTGTDAARYVSPDALAGSNYGKRFLTFVLPYGLGGTLLTGDGQAGLPITSEFNGWNIVNTPLAQVGTAGTTGTTDFQIRRVRSGAAVDVLSTKITIDSTEISSADAATPPVINAANDDLATGDWLYIDVDALSTTVPLGPVVVIVPIQLP